MCKEGNACHKGERDTMEDKYVKVGKAEQDSKGMLSICDDTL